LHGFKEDDEVGAYAWAVTKLVYSDAEGRELISSITIPPLSIADLFAEGSAAKELVEFKLAMPDLQDSLF
jgi:hypothetical protein